MRSQCACDASMPRHKASSGAPAASTALPAAPFECEAASRWPPLKVRGTSMLMRLILGLLVMLPATALAEPVTIVSAADGNGAWWIQPMAHRPIASRLGNVTVEDINRDLAERVGALTPLKVCYVGALSGANIVGFTRKVQAEINETMKAYPSAFRRTFDGGAGKLFTIEAGVYEACDGATSAFVMMTDAAGKLHSFFAQEPRFVWLPEKSKGSVGLSGCFYCGDMTLIHYDQRRDAFYFEYIGD